VSDTERNAGEAPAPGAGGVHETTLLDVVNVLLRYRLSIILIPLLFMAAGVALSMSQPRLYRADGAFMLQDATNGRTRVSGLAAQFGVSVAGGAQDVPQLYADLLVSRRFMRQLARTRFEFTAGGTRHSGTPDRIFGIEETTPQRREWATLEMLRNSVSSDVNPMTGVVSVAVSTPWPAFSEQIGQRILEMVTQFNVSTRQSQAAAERRFTEARLNEARGELRSAENALQNFMETNRRFDNAPQLLMRRERLQREVTQRQAVFSLLAEAYERARMDEVRDTPVITVIEGPAGSARAQSRGTLTRGLLMFVLGLMVAVGIAFWREMLRLARVRQAPELTEFIRLRNESLGRGKGRRPAAAG
jgi:uncharacterized protein involved in exopolysaccharide biosynthesis